MFFSPYYRVDTLLDAEDKAVKKANKISDLMGPTF